MGATMRYLNMALIGVLLAGCTGTGIVQVNEDTYMVSSTGTSPLLTGTSPLSTATDDAIKESYREATEFCKEHGGSVESVSLETAAQAYGRPGRATLHFQCIDRESNEKKTPD